jgi:predicted esterase
MRALAILLFSLFVATSVEAARAPSATESDVEYGKHERNKMDFWKAKSSKPTPVLVYFHGGGFKMGDKRNIHIFFNVKDYLNKDVSCITVNYPFLQHTNNNHMAIMKHCKDAIDFIKKNAKKWNIDTKRIGVSGCSAGALVTEWLGYTTRDVSAMSAYLQPMGTEYFVLRNIKRSSPPLMIYQASAANDKLHHPKYAKMVKDACDKKKAPCELYGSQKNDIENLPGGDPKKSMLKFFCKHWKIK